MLVQQLVIEILTWAWTVFYCKQRTLGTNGWHYMYVFIQDVMQLQQCTVTTTTVHLDDSHTLHTLCHSSSRTKHTWFCVRFPAFPWISPACLDPYCKKPYFSDHVEEFLDLLHQHIRWWLNEMRTGEPGKQSTKHVQIVGCGPLIIIEIIYEGLSYFPQLSLTLTFSLQPSNMTIMWPNIKQEWITHNLQHD